MNADKSAYMARRQNPTRRSKPSPSRGGLGGDGVERSCRKTIRKLQVSRVLVASAPVTHDDARPCLRLAQLLPPLGKGAFCHGLATNRNDAIVDAQAGACRGAALYHVGNPQRLAILEQPQAAAIERVGLREVGIRRKVHLALVVIEGDGESAQHSAAEIRRNVGIRKSALVAREQLAGDT